MKRDRNGLLYDPESDWPVPLTECCHAAVTCDEQGFTVCKGCYQAVSPAYGMPVEPFEEV